MKIKGNLGFDHGKQGHKQSQTNQFFFFLNPIITFGNTYEQFIKSMTVISSCEILHLAMHFDIKF